ncbi:MAG: amino acid synthesis family protein, partial [Methyloligellaceae bacterium]
MPDVVIRKSFISFEETVHEGGPVTGESNLKGAAVASIHNPFAGSYIADIASF